MKIDLFLLPVLVVCAAPSLNLDDRGVVQNIAKNMVNTMMAYYNKNNLQGSIPPVNSNDARAFQWFEGGLFMGIVTEYMKTSNDLSLATQSTQALTLASYGTIKSFLGSNEVLASTVGKWNDDILWWAMGPMIGAEIFGPNTMMPGGVSYGDLVANTLRQAYNFEDGTCGGGIWWKRDKHDYKSTISNTLAMILSARLSLVTGNQTLIQQSVQLYQWLKASQLISNSKVFDGIKTVNGKCEINIDEHSYESGTVVGGLAWIYAATKNVAFINDAHAIFAYAASKFAPNGIVTDDCELKNSCSPTVATPKGGMLRGWSYLHEYTTSDNVRMQMRQILKTSVAAMLQTCDSNWNCGNDWARKQPPSAYNVHYQMNAVELITAYLKTFTKGPVGQKSANAPMQAPPKDDSVPVPNGSAVIGLSFFVGVAAVFATLFY